MRGNKGSGKRGEGERAAIGKNDVSPPRAGGGGGWTQFSEKVNMNRPDQLDDSPSDFLHSYSNF